MVGSVEGIAGMSLTICVGDDLPNAIAILIRGHPPFNLIPFRVEG
jgi:hypothetical protein